VSDEAAVARSVVIKVLRAFAVSVVESGDQITISRGNQTPIVLSLPEVAHRRMLGRLSSKYDIPIHFFWHPEQIPKP